MNEQQEDQPGLQAETEVSENQNIGMRTITGGKPGDAGTFWLAFEIDPEEFQAKVSLRNGEESILEIELEQYFRNDRLRKFQAPQENAAGFNADIAVMIDWEAKRLETEGRFILMEFAKEERICECNFTLQSW